MIVTCESCKSRYKLDDAKITGKGAKITCPKCRNVFVVYARPDAAAADEPTTTSPPPGPPSWEPRKSGGLADAVKAADRDAERAPTPGRVVAGSGGPAPVNASPPPRDGGTGHWDDEPTRVGVLPPSAPEAHAHEVRRPSAPDAPAGPPSIDPATGAARAATLDFRKVGVTTWKVKVKIGLIYDFSDIKTLRKYITDGRVTPADVVSWDGKVWRAIGEIPDLDAFFVETYDLLSSRKPDAPAPNPTLMVTAEQLRADEGAAVAAPPLKSGGEPTQFADPFAAQARKKADGKRTGGVTTPVQVPKKGASAPDRTPMFAGAVLLLLAIGGGVWWMGQTPAPTAPPPGAPASKGTTPPVKSADTIRQEIEAGLKASVASNPAPDEAPTGATTKAADPAPVRAPPPPTAREDRVPVRPPDATATTTRRRTPPPSGMAVADQTAADHEAVGDDSAGSGDWSTAAQAYKKAAALDARSARLAGKLGRALFETGDTAGARGYLSQAATGGVKDANKFLGHIARQDGDTAGANSAYQQYLKGSPRDAAEIQAIIDKMNGG